MSSRISTHCDNCHKQIPATKGFRLGETSWIGVRVINPGDYCIACLAEMCGERLMTPDDRKTLKALEEEQVRRIDEERREKRDW